jgi:glycosyltransferase involved in cell wall biosynthesis
VKEQNPFRKAHGLDGKFVVMYSGNLGMSQNLAHVLDAAEELRSEDSIVFVFVGDGAERPKLESIARDRQLTNVRFYDYQPKSELAISLSAADVHLVVLQSHIQRLVMPSKIYGVFASGTPVIALTTGECELAEIIRDHDLGQVISGEDARELAATVKKMAGAPGSLDGAARNAREYAETNCTRAASVHRLRSLFASMLDRRECGQSDSRRGSAEVSPRVEAVPEVLVR